jgi:hypothetical protein
MSLSKFYLFLSIFFLLTNDISAQEKILSPKQYLGYELGEQFTFHHKVISYYDYVAKNSDKVRLEVYGKTSERRPLVTAIISSKENIQNLEEIRKNNLRATGLEEGAVSQNLIPIIWLSYNIHGDEAAGTEAALKTIHHLITNKQAQEWLKETIVIIDPCENPDGRDRYANWYNQVVNKNPNPNENSIEHNQPWPGGRFNHYLFDLNRDWAWQTQVESSSRIKLYHQWMPHIHIDLHEMGHNSSYFFAPAAAPFHEVITDWQRDFQHSVGNNNAKYFDKKGWLYYTNEVFDLLYPSYGDTWPTFNGAIGFTYEQGGSGKAGISVQQKTGNYLQLKDRLEHHFTTSISSIQMAFENKEKLLSEFKKYFNEPINDQYKSYVIKHSNEKSKISALLTLLNQQKIQYGTSKLSEISQNGFDFLKNNTRKFKLEEHDIVIRLKQPLSRFVKVLFEPQTMVEDSLTYDLTAWAIPYIYELEAYALEQDIPNNIFKQSDSFQPTELPRQTPYAIAIEYKDVVDVAILSELLQKNLVVRFAEQPFKVNNKEYARGSLLITKGDNGNRSEYFDKEVIQIANKHKKSISFLSTGIVSAGYNLGSNNMKYIKAPKVAIIGGDGISPTAYGEVWYYFEQVIDYPVTTIHTSYLKRINLSQYDVIIMPSGNYGQFSKKLLEFAQNGGKIITLDRATSQLARHSDTAFNTKKSNFSKTENKDPIKYAERNRASASRLVEGSIYKIYLDDTHPLSFGFENSVHIMKRSSTVFESLAGNGWTVGTFKDNSHISGFVGADLKKDLKNSAALAVENYGRGSIVYFPDSPIFRGFWHSGKLLFGNAIFFVGQ